jgi:hypothetical protein
MSGCAVPSLRVGPRRALAFNAASVTFANSERIFDGCSFPFAINEDIKLCTLCHAVTRPLRMTTKINEAHFRFNKNVGPRAQN